MAFRSKGTSVDGKLFENKLYFIDWILVVVQLLKHVLLFPTPWTAAYQASLFFTISQSLLKFLSIESVMLTILSSNSPFSFCLQSFQASGSFPVSQLFTSGGQSIGASASVSVPSNDWILEGQCLGNCIKNANLEFGELEGQFS